ncbi:MAG: DNA adenine methylase [Blastocatellia bacterium]
MNYPGGKNCTYRHIINQMPPHRVYIEPFLGSGAVLRHKRPAQVNIGLDMDSAAIAAFGDAGPCSVIKCGDAISFLKGYHLREPWRDDVLIYLDPPYVMSSRSSQAKIYRHEMTDGQHFELLQTILDVSSWRVKIMISGYYSDLYAKVLAHWRHITFKTIKRSGKPATEYLWMNFPEPLELHDYRYLGENFREREQITRQQKRHRAKLATMTPLRRYALLSVLEELKNQDPASPETARLADIA